MPTASAAKPSQEVSVERVLKYSRHHVGRSSRLADDGACVLCRGCKTELGGKLRRHYCRVCGNVFCANCSSNVLSVRKEHYENGQEKHKRACNACFAKASKAKIEGTLPKKQTSSADVGPRRGSSNGLRVHGKPSGGNVQSPTLTKGKRTETPTRRGDKPPGESDGTADEQHSEKHKEKPDEKHAETHVEKHDDKLTRGREALKTLQGHKRDSFGRRGTLGGSAFTAFPAAAAPAAPVAQPPTSAAETPPATPPGGIVAEPSAELLAAAG